MHDDLVFACRSEDVLRGIENLNPDDTAIRTVVYGEIFSELLRNNLLRLIESQEVV